MEEWPEEIVDAGAVERDFFQSLSHLAALYSFTIPDTSGKLYPLNIAYAHWQMEDQLKQLPEPPELLIVQHERSAACLTTRKVFDTGRTLFYIPVRPLVHLIKNAGEQPAVAVLLCIFSYLNRKADIPFYTYDSFVARTYGWMEMNMEDDMNNGEPECDHQPLLDELKTAHHYGLIVERLLKKEKHLAEWGGTIAKFEPMGKWQERLNRLAQDFLKLYQDFPESNIYKNILAEPPEEVEDDWCMLPEHYVSFFWGCEGEGYETFMEYVNCELLEMSRIEEPTVCQLFDKPQCCVDLKLDYECRLFYLLDEFIGLLNDYEHERYHAIVPQLLYAGENSGAI